MPLRPNSAAPYGPPAGVLDVIHGYRNRGLSTPFTGEVLLRLGISESLVPRVLKSLEGLDLIDKDGNPTTQLEGLRRATTDEFPARLEEVIRAVYADVFNFADPTNDTPERIADAFRAYEPIGQRGRMVTLFLGLCEAAGIIKPGAKKPSSNGASARPRATQRPERKQESTKKPASFGPLAHIRNDQGAVTPAAFQGLLASLPAVGTPWQQSRRDAFVKMFESVLDYHYPIGEPPSQTNDEDADLDDE